MSGLTCNACKKEFNEGSKERLHYSSPIGTATISKFHCILLRCYSLKTVLEHLHCNLDSIGKLPSINNPRCSRPGPDRVIAGKGKELRHVQQPPKLELHIAADLSEQGHKQLQQIYND
ncbi:hypothetical protein SLEP1_g1896 [Rubroshorea leprosula]|uniref:C2H2-type domain-containing protein n=1 Tax=Rubroshorea leprosula TaxID=152421 RepID=A0AAV5HQP7_9ROSI|nr:hypothetical protein SLEP1_g1896 [Rubroshorea leprosula]